MKSLFGSFSTEKEQRNLFVYSFPCDMRESLQHTQTYPIEGLVATLPQRAHPVVSDNQGHADIREDRRPHRHPAEHRQQEENQLHPDC